MNAVVGKSYEHYIYLPGYHKRLDQAELSATRAIGTAVRFARPRLSMSLSSNAKLL